MATSDEPTKRPSFLKILFTAAAAAFGVQTEKNLKQDFAQQSAIPYIIVGVVFTGLFLGALITLVSFIV